MAANVSSHSFPGLDCADRVQPSDPVQDPQMAAQCDGQRHRIAGFGARAVMNKTTTLPPQPGMIG
jgi:hypothetical protein